VKKLVINPKRLDKEYKLFDLHVHSFYSYDCKSNPKDIIKHAEKIGLNGLAITDHNTVSFHKNKDVETNLLIIPGIEISTSNGHLIGLGVSETIEKNKSVAETIEIIRDYGGEIIVPHLFDFLRKGIGRKIAKVNFSDLAIETVNASCLTKLFNDKARNFAEKNSLAQTGGSDSHRVKDVGLAYTLIPKDVETVDDVLESVRKKETLGEGTILSIYEKVIRSFQIHF